MTTLFSTHQQFELACLAFIEQHQSTSKATYSQTVASPSVQAGWKWEEHPVYPGNGYMSRRDLQSIRPRTAPPGALCIDELEEEEDDPSTAQPTRIDDASYVEVEWNVVYSKTYRIPQLCFNVSDATGSPLPLCELIATGIIFHQAPNPIQIHDDHLDLSSEGDNGDSIMDSTFPLLQRVHHPYPHHEGMPSTVWSIHPCHVQDTIAEILAYPSATSIFLGARASSNTARNQPGKNKVGIDESANRLQAQLQWLNCWFMVTSTLLDLRR